VPLFKTRSAAVYGIDAHPIDVEVDMYRSGMAKDFVLVGMPDTAVRESRERIKSAMMNSGFGYPNKAVTINSRPRMSARKARDSICPWRSGFSGRWGRLPAWITTC
jgi:magnesium chelatase family protein